MTEQQERKKYVEKVLSRLVDKSQFLIAMDKNELYEYICSNIGQVLGPKFTTRDKEELIGIFNDTPEAWLDVKNSLMDNLIKVTARELDDPDFWKKHKIDIDEMTRECWK